VSALTSIRNLLTEKPGGMTRAQLLEKSIAGDTLEVLRALKDLRDNGQIIRLGDGDSAYYVLASAARSTELMAPSKPVDIEKPRPAITHVIEPSKPQVQAIAPTSTTSTLPRGHLRTGSTSGRLGLFIFEQKSPDGWAWVPLSQMHSHLAAVSKAEIGRINTALVWMVNNGYMEKHKTTRGMYRWANKFSYPFKYLEGKEMVPSKVVLIDLPKPDESSQEPQTIKHEKEIIKVISDGSFIEKLQIMEAKALDEFISKARSLVIGINDEQRIELAKLMSRIDTLQECIEIHEIEAAA
jgi:hypothetical protein